MLEALKTSLNTRTAKETINKTKDLNINLVGEATQGNNLKLQTFQTLLKLHTKKNNLLKLSLSKTEKWRRIKDLKRSTLLFLTMKME